MNAYDQYASKYARFVQSRDEWGFSAYLDLVIPALMETLGEVRGLAVLDAGCGEGTVTRMLASRGAQVTGMDISPNLITLASESETQHPLGITYLVHDLDQPLPDYTATFDLAVSNLALNDVADYQGFVRTAAAMIRPGGRFVLSLDSPYSAIERNKVQFYFESGRISPYYGLAAAGVPSQYHHHTLEEYVRAFRDNGLLVRTLIDVKPGPQHLASGSPLAKTYYRFPYFLVLELVKLAP